ncbi:MAG: HEPN domain-containing protein [Candidatus Omnitrophica bacterium]|nr:HEPN domain-containing protein [Candidatus Omnitrophota bacterium]MBU1785110.1 HEPN domain-containing protein [Candidatus Omnitrophota bacterium]MBU1850797.1 HEPN domain-containing protein [Candidatus Omnitrophota bacterium]
MAERSKDWMNQAKRDFQAAQEEEKKDFFEWACFIHQQAAEKAVKAVYQKLSAEAWGHSVFSLFKGLREKLEIDQDLLESAKLLDRFYISARYPNGWVEGFPGELITRKEAESAGSCAEKIIRFCEGILAK